MSDTWITTQASSYSKGKSPGLDRLNGLFSFFRHITRHFTLRNYSLFLSIRRTLFGRYDQGEVKKTCLEKWKVNLQMQKAMVKMALSFT